jgi:hypothetical protein
MIPVSNDPPRLAVTMDPADMAELVSFARQFQTSPAALGRLAVDNLLAQLRQGASPMVPASTIQKAVRVSFTGGAAVTVKGGKKPT